MRRSDDERRQRRASAQALHARGASLTTAGLGLAALGLLVSVGSYAAAAAGGLYVVWSGAIVGGLAMVVRGRGLSARARALDADGANPATMPMEVEA